MPDPVPAPADLLGTLPAADVGEAVMILARMISRAARPQIWGAGDE